MTKSVAFQGERGAYSEEAVFRYFGDDVTVVPLPSMADVFESISEGKADYAVVPFENSIEGGVNEVMGLLRESQVVSVGEVIVLVTHCLICNPEADPSKITFVYSHPQALGQCRNYIRKSRMRPIPFYDTAGSVKEILGKLDSSAIASKRAASIYGMRVVAEGIEDYENNYTRFLVITTRSEVPGPTGRDKTSVVFSLQHRSGELFRALETFASRGINLTRIESRPARQRLWEYDFFVDFEGHVADRRVSDALEELVSRATLLKILGSYPSAEPAL